MQLLVFILWTKMTLPQSVQLKHKHKTFCGDLATSNNWTVFFELRELKVFSIKYFPQDICQTTKKLMRLSYLQAERLVLLAQNSRFRLKRELCFGTRKKQQNMRKWQQIRVRLAGNRNALSQKLIVKDIPQLHSGKYFNSLDSLQRIEKPCW